MDTTLILIVVEPISAEATIVGTGTAQIYLKVIASSSIGINSSGGTVLLTGKAFAPLEAGGKMVISPSDTRFTGFIAPEGSVVIMKKVM